MPELPEVEALAGFLRERVVGRVVARIDVLAISALKTYDPPVTALGGLTVTAASRHGKFVERSRGLEARDLKGEKKTGLRVHARAGRACPVCGDTIREVSFADSSLQYCPTCQTGGKPLADRRMSRLLK